MADYIVTYASLLAGRVWRFVLDGFKWTGKWMTSFKGNLLMTKLYVSCLIGFVGLIKYALYSSEEEFNICAFGA